MSLGLHRRKLRARELDTSEFDKAYNKVYDAHPNWYNLGLALSVDPNQLTSIQNTNQGRTDCDEVCLRQMLDKRLQAAPLTWRDLCSALRSRTVCRHDVAEEIEQSLPYDTSDDEQVEVIKKLQNRKQAGIVWRAQLGTIIFGFLTVLCMLCCYWWLNAHKGLVYKEFAEELYSKYSSAAIIDKEQELISNVKGIIGVIPFILPVIKSGEPLDQIIQDIQPGSRTLFSGRPGVGKSTLARYMAHKWAKDKVPTHCVLTVLVPLSFTIPSLYEVLAKVLRNFSTLFISEVVSEINSTHGRGICFVIDALDEYVPAEKGEDDWVFNLIKGDTLRQSTVIVMSRNDSRVQKFVNTEEFSAQYEVAGFSANGLNLYLDQLPLELKSNILSVFDVNINVKLMCYLPLHMTMVLHLASADRNKLNAIVTETVLYTRFLELTIEHKDTHGTWTAEMVRECLKEDRNTVYLCNLLYRICAQAFNSVLRDEVWFDSSDFNSTEVDMLQRMNLFGIEIKTDGRIGKFYHFTFAHKTFQEYLAGFHMCRSSDAFHEMLHHAGKYHPIWKFYFGVLGNYILVDEPEKVYRSLINLCSNYGYRKCHHVDGEELLRIAYEAGLQSLMLNFTQDTSLITGPECDNYTLEYFFWGTEHCLYFAYILNWIPVRRYKLRIFENSDTYLTDFVNKQNCIEVFEKEFMSQRNGQIQELDVSIQGKDTEQAWVQLLSNVHAYDLKSFGLSFHQPECPKDQVLTREIWEWIANQTQLKRLWTSGIGENDLTTLREILVKLKSLQTLDITLYITNISESFVNRFADCLIADNLRELAMTLIIRPDKELVPTEEGVTTQAISKLGRSMTHLSRLRFCCITSSEKLDAVHVPICSSILAGALEHMWNLERLIISGKICMDSNLLKHAFSVAKKLTTLEFESCLFTKSETEAVFNSLKEANTLRTLIITYWSSSWYDKMLPFEIIKNYIIELSQLQQMELNFPDRKPRYIQEISDSLSSLPNLESIDVSVRREDYMYVFDKFRVRYRVIARFSSI